VKPPLSTSARRTLDPDTGSGAQLTRSPTEDVGGPRVGVCTVAVNCQAGTFGGLGGELNLPKVSRRTRRGTPTSPRRTRDGSIGSNPPRRFCARGTRTSSTRASEYARFSSNCQAAMGRVLDVPGVLVATTAIRLRDTTVRGERRARRFAAPGPCHRRFSSPVRRQRWPERTAGTDRGRDNSAGTTHDCRGALVQRRPIRSSNQSRTVSSSWLGRAADIREATSMSNDLAMRSTSAAGDVRDAGMNAK
jgi:hypothetical protein